MMTRIRVIPDSPFERRLSGIDLNCQIGRWMPIRQWIREIPELIAGVLSREWGEKDLMTGAG
jgi:hypothetical protein